MDTITFFFGHNALDSNIVNKKGILATPMDLFRENISVDIPQEVLTENIRSAVTKVAAAFEPIADEMKMYVVDEIEFGLTVGTDGKVGIVAAEASASMEASIRVKLKRKDA